VIKTVVNVWHNEQSSAATVAVAPVYENQRGHPILFDRALWPELLALPEGSAPRDVLTRHPDRLRLIPVDDDGILVDLDTQQQYQHLKNGV